MAKDAYFFSHDSNARNDPKILAMRSVYGSDGYGLYWMIIETLREQNDYKLVLMKYTINALAMQMQCESTKFEQFIKECCEDFELLSTDGNYLWCETLTKRMSHLDKTRIKRKMAADKRWNKTTNDSENDEENNDNDAQNSNEDANAVHMHNDEDANAIQDNPNDMQSKVKKSKVDNIKLNKNIYTVEFEAFYNLYPNPQAKSDTFNSWNKRLKNGMSIESIMVALDNYKMKIKSEGKDIKFSYSSNNFLGTKNYIDDFLEGNFKKSANIADVQENEWDEYGIRKRVR